MTLLVDERPPQLVDAGDDVVDRRQVGVFAGAAAYLTYLSLLDADSRVESAEDIRRSQALQPREHSRESE